MYNEAELWRMRNHLQRLEQNEYVLGNRLERMYRELAMLMHSIRLEENNMAICVQEQKQLANKIHTAENHIIGNTH